MRQKRAVRKPSNLAVHCSFSDRASTDLITNATVFSGIDLQQDIWRLFSGGGFPPDVLPAVLHESAHHWCFFTPVATTIALLQARSRIRCLEWAFGKDDAIAGKALEDGLKYEVATMILRPLAEGIAQFFEYDVVPCAETPVASQPMSWAHDFLFGFLPGSKSSWGNSLWYVLDEMRRSDAMIRRKANLLVQPLKCSAGGYLLGYLNVKNLWRACRAKHGAFWDADLFACLMRHYFYRDHGLVDLILNESADLTHWTGSIVQYLCDRGNRLYMQLDLKAAEKALIKQSLKPGKTTLHGDESFGIDLGQSPPMGTSRRVADRGFRRLVNLFDSMKTSFSKTAFSDAADTARNILLMPFTYRHLLWLGQLKTKLRGSDDGKVTVLVNDKQLIKVDLLSSGTKIPDTAILDLYVSVWDNFVGIVVSETGGKAIAALTLGTATEAAQERFLKLYGDRQLAEDENKAYADIYMNLPLTAEFKTFHTFLLKWGEELVEQDFYRGGALMWVSEKWKSAVPALMENNGILAVVGGDLQLLRSAAALSLAASLRMKPEDVASGFPVLKLSALAILEQLDQCTKKRGFPMVVGEPGKWLSSFI